MKILRYKVSVLDLKIQAFNEFFIQSNFLQLPSLITWHSSVIVMIIMTIWSLVLKSLSVLVMIESKKVSGPWFGFFRKKYVLSFFKSLQMMFFWLFENQGLLMFLQQRWVHNFIGFLLDHTFFILINRRNVNIRWILFYLRALYSITLNFLSQGFYTLLLDIINQHFLASDFFAYNSTFPNKWIRVDQFRQFVT